MATITRKSSPLQLNAEKYKRFKERANGKITAKRHEEVRKAGEALRGVHIYKLTK
ncbi:hypothetical protein [Lacticaseibacillus manihotivorans]|nr:hypothetical protein [Lacticaseibacillus manihotivorans]